MASVEVKRTMNWTIITASGAEVLSIIKRTGIFSETWIKPMRKKDGDAKEGLEKNTAV